MISPVPEPLPTSATTDEKKLFEQRVARWQAPLFAYLGRLGFRQSDAEDLAQECFLRAWRARAQFDASKASYATWLFSIARNLSADLWQRSGRHEHLQSTVQTDALIAKEQATDLQESDALNRQLHQALERLSLEDRQVISLACVQDLTAGEAAQLSGCTPATFRTRLSRARARLKSHLEALT